MENRAQIFFIKSKVLSLSFIEINKLNLLQLKFIKIKFLNFLTIHFKRI